MPSWRPDVDARPTCRRGHAHPRRGQHRAAAGDASTARSWTTLQIHRAFARRALAVRRHDGGRHLGRSFRPSTPAAQGGQDSLAAPTDRGETCPCARPRLPGLLAAQRNADRGLGDVALFEVSAPGTDGRPKVSAVVAAGVRSAPPSSKVRAATGRAMPAMSVCSTRPMPMRTRKPAARLSIGCRSRRELRRGTTRAVRA